jgi:putative hydrolase
LQSGDFAVGSRRTAVVQCYFGYTRVSVTRGKTQTRRRGSGPPDRGGAPPRADEIDDINMRAAGLLHDMAALQPSDRAQFGYKRAAKAVIGLPLQVSDLLAAGTLADVPFVGPSSVRIIRELVEQGRSPTVDAAVSASTRRERVETNRRLRDHFLSQFAAQQALAQPLDPRTVARAAFRGDFQTHSTYSDGGESIRTMAEACIALGHTCLGVTDHSYGLPVARGMSMEAALRQHHEIDRLNAAYAGRFRIFKGIEANILADGALDLSPDERRRFEFVVASPHSLLRRADDQTARVVGAVRAEAVAILGHPRGRMFNSRAGVVADWTRVFAEASRRRVAIELDGNWHRQDLDYMLVRDAVEAGCIFALDSDAHSIGELRFTDYAIAHARLAGVPARRVINCWTDAELETWMEDRRA